jgi:aerobic carbon-monoxide dehydrogenase medium subunit
MKPAPFRYIAAQSREEALAVKAEHGEEASFLAGGQSLVPALNFRLAQPAVLIDLNGLPDLTGVRRDDGVLRVGAMTRHATLEHDALVARHQPLIHEAMPFIAHLQIRNRGTIGGNLAHSDPASELPAIVLALGGRLRAQSAGGERWIEAHDFFAGALTTALAPDEMLAEIALPDMAPGTGTCFMEVARRRGDFAILGVAAWVTLGPDLACSGAGLAYCGLGDGPFSPADVASSLVGHPVDDEAIRAASAMAQAAVDPPGNIHASKDYQRHLAGVLTRRALQTAAERARAAVDASGQERTA